MEPLENFEEPLPGRITQRHALVLLHSHFEYRARHQVQLDLISSGIVSEAIASSWSRFPRCKGLRFVSSARPFPASTQLVHLMDHPEELKAFLLRPHSFLNIEGIVEDPILHSVQLLTEVPIAISEAGGTIRDLSIECFPLRTNHSRLFCVFGKDEESQQLNRLRQSSMHLKSFHFGREGISHKDLRYKHLAASDFVSMSSYLGAILSSECLSDLHLNFYAFGINNGLDDNFQCPLGLSSNPSLSSALLHSGQAVAQARSRHLRAVHISNTSVRYEELNSLISTLGDAVEMVNISHMHLLSGMWADIIECLRNKVSARCQIGLCFVKLGNLRGGELDDMQGKKICDKFEEYVSGKSIDNPLR